MKKLVLILVGFALLLTICSCTGNGTENTEDGTSVEVKTDENGEDVTTGKSNEDTSYKSDEDTSVTEPATESENPENDPYWTDNY